MKVTGPARGSDFFVDLALGDLNRAESAIRDAHVAIDKAIDLRNPPQPEVSVQASSCREYTLEDYLEQLVQSAAWLIRSRHFNKGLALMQYIDGRVDFNGNVKPITTPKGDAS